MTRKPTRSIFWTLCAVLTCLLAFGGTVRAQTDSPVDVSSQRNPAYQALATGNVYVDPAVNGIDTQALEQATGQDEAHPRAKIVVLSALPSWYLSGLDRAMSRSRSLARQVSGKERSFYAYNLYKGLNLGKTPLVLVVLTGRDSGASVWTTTLNADQRKALADQYAPQISANPTAGTAALAQAAAGDITGQERRSTAGLWGFFLLVVAVIGGLLLMATRRKKAQLGAARVPLQALRENVLQGIEYLDGYMDVLPKNNPDSDAVRTYRQAASGKYEQAAKLMDRATEMTDLNRAQSLFDQAQADVQQSRRYLDRATGGTGNIPGDDAPEPLPASQPQVDAIPENQRGVSFFSGRPAPLGSLVPVTITINGQSRQVLVTPDEAEDLRRGRMPQVLAFQQGGQQVPWYEYQGYDPYRDYWRYQNSGWGGMGTGLVAGFVGAELLGGLMSPAYGMGYSPYAYATDMSGYQNYSTPDYNSGGFGSGGFGGGDAGGYDTGGFNDAGGGGFFNNDGGSFDTQGFDDAGGGNFMDIGGFDGGGFDGGGFDGGGGGDFGGGN